MHRWWRPSIRPSRLSVAVGLAALVTTTLASCGPDRPANASGEELTSVTTLDHTIAAGGRPARFRVTVHNGSSSRQRTALLIETPIVGSKPSQLHLDRLHGATWIPVSVQWDDADEPELIRSRLLPIDVTPGRSATYGFRVGLPGTYTPCRYDDCGSDVNKQTFGVSVILVSVHGSGYQPGPGRGARFRLGPDETARLTVTPPRSVTFAGGPAEFAVGVDNSGGHPHSRTRLGVTLKGTMDGLAADRTELELFEAGSWRRLPLVDADRQLHATLADRAAMPVGYRATYRLRLSLGLGAGETAQNGTKLTLIARLDDVADAGTPVSLADVAQETELASPIVTVDIPSMSDDRSTDAPNVRRPAIGTAYEFSVTIDNPTAVTYPPLGVVLEATGAGDLARNLTVRYRAAGSSAWTAAPPTDASAPGVGRERYRVPRDGARAAPPGFRQTYQVQLVRKSGTNVSTLVELRADGVDSGIYLASGPDLYPPSR